MAVRYPEPSHSVNQASLRYWLEKKGDRPMPSRADIDPIDIPKLLPYVILLNVRHEPLDFGYRLVGSVVRYHLNKDLSGQWMREIPHQQPGSVIWTTLGSVVADRRPVSSSIPYVGPHKDCTISEDMIMPLSKDGEQVDMMFVTIAYGKH